MLKRYLPRSLYARVLLIVILPIFLMQAFVTYVFFDRHWDLVTANLSANVAGQIALVAAEYPAADDRAARRALERRSLEKLDLSVRFEPGKTVPQTDKRSFFALYDNTLDRELGARIEGDYWFDTSSWPAYVEIRVQLTDGYLVFFPLRDRVFATTGPIFVLWLVGATLLLGWIGVLFMRNQVRSILRLAQAAEAFGRGRDIPGFRPGGATEVRRAGFAFVTMRERIKRQIHQRTAMLAGVSHDLRTPITRMKLALAMQPDTPDIEALRADALEMERLVEAYLNFARDISGGDPVPVDMAALLLEVADEARRAGADVSIDLDPPLVASGRRDALKRAVSNLVGNARKYAGHVFISARKTRSHVEIIIDDDGPGIAPEDVEEAFKPFRQLHEGRNASEGGGVGLGLSVVREVARSHGGEITLEKSPQGGLRAVLKIPM